MSLRARVRGLAVALGLAVVGCGGAKGAASAAAHPKSAALEPLVKYEQFKLENGLDVVLVVDHALPVVAVDVHYGVGSREDPKGKGGLAHLFEHLMFEGTTSLSHADLLAKLDEAGQSYFNATTSRDATHYVTRVGARGLEFVLWMEADRLTTLGASVTQARLDSVRKVVEQERLQSVDNAPYGLVGQFVEAALYPKGHPYRRPPIGTIAELESITLDDLRRFFATNYVPDNATIAVVGDFDPATCKRWLDQYFKPIPRGKAARQPQPPIVFRPAPARRITVEADVSQPLVQLAWSVPALAADGDDALDALALLGPTLRRTLVEAHRVTEAGIDHPSSPLGSRFDVSGVGAAGANVDRMEADLREALTYVAAKPRLVDHLDAERRVLIGQLKGQLEDPSEIAQTLSFAAAELGDPDHLAREISNLEALTIDSVRAAWRTYLDDYEPVVVRVLPTPGAPHAGRVVKDEPYAAPAAATGDADARGGAR